MMWRMAEPVQGPEGLSAEVCPQILILLIVNQYNKGHLEGQAAPLSYNDNTCDCDF